MSGAGGAREAIESVSSVPAEGMFTTPHEEPMDVEKQAVETGTVLVQWEPADPENPHNWSNVPLPFRAKHVSLTLSRAKNLTSSSPPSSA